MLNPQKSLLFLIFLMLIPIAHAKIDVDKLGDRLEAVTPEGDTLIFPTLKTDIEVDIQGDLATVAVQQTFEQAKQEGKSAALLKQHRPKITISSTNIYM
ncbi:hypothetical protein PN36_10015 [Candidatus Thiomargarita nelsonii]|uniref:Uncharacterized protein n=1 Tax=Candidatus Thiomargarita nelsonii TaxID=1003181 RepID=A0A0A6PFB3_9GAMM|nr:hypothetical protein PN36_10015 [Candidatus Thiomargarita nelsonii]